MNFTLGELREHKPGSGRDSHPDADIKGLIVNMSDQIPFAGMRPVGR